MFTEKTHLKGNHEELLKKHPGKYLLIKGNSVYGAKPLKNV